MVFYSCLSGVIELVFEYGGLWALMHPHCMSSLLPLPRVLHDNISQTVHSISQTNTNNMLSGHMAKSHTHTKDNAGLLVPTIFPSIYVFIGHLYKQEACAGL